MSVRVTLPRLDTTNVKNFSAQEDATPVEPSSSFGGVGRITFNVEETEDAPLFIGSITLVDGSKGKTSGVVISASGTDGDVSVVADSVLGLFNTDRTVLPYVGTLGGAIQYYADLVGITNDVMVDLSVSPRGVVYPGWTGNVWVKIKQILVKEQVEMALVFNRVYVRPLRQLEATLDRSTTLAWNVDNADAARAVDINYYNHVYGTQQEIYPLTTEDPSIYQVDASETITFTQQLNASVVSLNQPVVQDWVDDASYAGTNGVYSVVGNDGLPITAAQWTAQGGSLIVAATDDPNTIEITIIGATSTDYAPYRIAMSSGGGTYYSSLHITATAVTWDKKVLRIPTGASNVTTSDEVGPTIDNPFINTLSDAYSLGMKAAQANAGLNYTIRGTALDINRVGAGQDLVVATIADFNVAYASGTTIATFNIEWLGQDISAFNTYFQDQVDVLFENQLFGNAPGARILRPDANFRVNSATTNESTVQFDASLDTLVSDFNDAWPALAPTARTNRVPNPACGINVTGYKASVAVTRVAQGGGWAAAVTFTAPEVPAYFASPQVSGAVVGRPYGARVTLTGPAGRQVEVWMHDGAGYVGATLAVVLTGVPQEIVVLPSAGIAAVANVRLYAYPLSFLAGDVLTMTRVLVEEVSGVGVAPGAYFDGDTPDTADVTYAWSGTAHASTSTETTYTSAIRNFNEQFIGYTCRDFSIVPLRRN